MSRIAAAYAAARGRTGLVPFVVAGYPSPEASLEMLRGFARQGALAAEIGVPFSDPIADGPDIQRASENALERGADVSTALDLVAALRRESEMPVVLMSYANPVLRGGVDRFAARARAAGLDGVLLSDLPPDEAPDVWSARLDLLLRRARGFVYCLSRTGVTGQGGGFRGPLAERITAVRRRSSLPVAVGFGISTAQDARALVGVADAVVVGAAFMRAAAAGANGGAVERVLALSSELIEALS
ncbi:MAG: tryptophan synthase subunit alpha [Candidatus Eisenbacteria bacterium]|uniref:Tryptophan synthase alpha chain n=1 Tax=Eiseniibacteriota bacterium TaxID=2212470 RepID=A0A538U3Z2_UNCEI|nr:MAG: tryptophan synthase subunit alpha [Candidatus Eisenbacteria bacterium]